MIHEQLVVNAFFSLSCRPSLAVRQFVLYSLLFCFLKKIHIQSAGWLLGRLVSLSFVLDYTAEISADWQHQCPLSLPLSTYMSNSFLAVYDQISAGGATNNNMWQTTTLVKASLVNITFPSVGYDVFSVVFLADINAHYHPAFLKSALLFVQSPCDG